MVLLGRAPDRMPSGPYFKDAGEGPGAIDVLVTRSTVRSAPGLMGSVKAGANYAGTLKVTEDAAAGSFLATGADQDIRGQCLPDTDDKRGPKGK